MSEYQWHREVMQNNPYEQPKPIGFSQRMTVLCMYTIREETYYLLLYRCKGANSRRLRHSLR